MKIEQEERKKLDLTRRGDDDDNPRVHCKVANNLQQELLENLKCVAVGQTKAIDLRKTIEIDLKLKI